jgi:hypothetical protein
MFAPITANRARYPQPAAPNIARASVSYLLPDLLPELKIPPVDWLAPYEGESPSDFPGGRGRGQGRDSGLTAPVAINTIERRI